ncbi:hypothetical protein EmuJ_000959400 [Echinococcus multilocularis]|uniref:Uncharacterized protein n=1 Tax=Echinococcus multilocularis TaxID=6211 RepID=A0A068YI61_ECHMU|nr:hypothetical protein EmuJ_000959400 [Echinococcus multilocularis]
MKRSLVDFIITFDGLLLRPTFKSAKNMKQSMEVCIAVKTIVLYKIGSWSVPNDGLGHVAFNSSPTRVEPLPIELTLHGIRSQENC